ncbi:MAG: glutamate--tRNA ligase [Candidatus Pacebacteria bacterium]|nr:glutamate--tRNA ligase [Candidatus Paceibacterota bacterium]
MNESNNERVVTRFAPSPTGFMHVGGVRTALFAWLFARKNGGKFILRIEDTDKKREVEGSIEHIIKSLKWVGLDWDEGPDVGGPNGPYIQSQRSESHLKYAQILIDKGLAYADPYTEEELEAFRKKAEIEKRPFLYRDHRPENPPIWDGTKPLRFKVPEIKTYEWFDLVRGNLSAGPEALDDFVLIKSDGYPTYNFAHIVDDLDMGVTHIFRTDEFISSTPKYLSLYEALEIQRPHIAILPPIMGDDKKKKLGKRDGAKDALDYKAEGYLPEALVNFLAFIGWNPGDEREIFTLAELVDAFSIDHIHKSGGTFNVEKLDWVNKEHIKRLNQAEQFILVQQFMPESVTNLDNYNLNILEDFLPLITERIEKFSDVTTLGQAGEFDYFFEKPLYGKDQLFYGKTKFTGENKYEDLAGIIGETIEHLKNATHWKSESIKDSVFGYAQNVGVGDVLWPMRFALSGQEKSPDPFILAEKLGHSETFERLEAAKNLLLN